MSDWASSSSSVIVKNPLYSPSQVDEYNSASITATPPQQDGSAAAERASYLMVGADVDLNPDEHSSMYASNTSAPHAHSICNTIGETPTASMFDSALPTDTWFLPHTEINPLYDHEWHGPAVPAVPAAPTVSGILRDLGGLSNDNYLPASGVGLAGVSTPHVHINTGPPQMTSMQANTMYGQGEQARAAGGFDNDLYHADVERVFGEPAAAVQRGPEENPPGFVNEFYADSSTMGVEGHEQRWRSLTMYEGVQIPSWKVPCLL